MKFLKLGVFLCVLLLFTAPANALLIDPADPSLIINEDYFTGNENDMRDIRDAIGEIFESLGLDLDPKEPLYKSEVDDGSEEGPLAGSYDTKYFDEPDDPSAATIRYVGGQYVGSPAWLLVKDGDQIPAWYLFDLTALGWDGMEDLVLEGFWPNQGAISNVSLYGTVPEPATMLLLGTGLIGLAGLGRKKFFKKS
jgi:hypothetical protein